MKRRSVCRITWRRVYGNSALSLRVFCRNRGIIWARMRVWRLISSNQTNSSPGRWDKRIFQNVNCWRRGNSSRRERKINWRLFQTWFQGKLEESIAWWIRLISELAQDLRRISNLDKENTPKVSRGILVTWKSRRSRRMSRKLSKRRIIRQLKTFIKDRKKRKKWSNSRKKWWISWSRGK